MTHLDTHTAIIGASGSAEIVGGQFRISGEIWADLEIIDRIVGRVVVEEECWIVPGFLNDGGHVKIENHQQAIWVHRAIFAWLNGPIADGKTICHHCDRGACIRPSHLFIGVQADNVADMRAKGRHVHPPHSYGQDHPSATLSDEEVATLREMAASGRYSQRELSRRFGVSQSTVWRLINEKSRSDGKGDQ